MGIKVISRAVLINKNSVLLVKNKNRDYWSLPGGHWEWDKESLKECAQRELMEETGLKALVDDLLFTQEFKSGPFKVVEFIWSATPEHTVAIDPSAPITHEDTDPESEIESMQWFNINNLNEINIKPLMIIEALRNQKPINRHVES